MKTSIFSIATIALCVGVAAGQKICKNERMNDRGLNFAAITKRDNPDALSDHMFGEVRFDCDKGGLDISQYGFVQRQQEGDIRYVWGCGGPGMAPWCSKTILCNTYAKCTINVGDTAFCTEYRSKEENGKFSYNVKTGTCSSRRGASKRLMVKEVNSVSVPTVEDGDELQLSREQEKIMQKTLPVEFSEEVSKKTLPAEFIEEASKKTLPVEFSGEVRTGPKRRLLQKGDGDC